MNTTHDTPDITANLRRKLLESLCKSHPNMSAADRRKLADRMIEHGRTLGLRMRRRRLIADIDRLRSDLKERGLRGAYPRSKWQKLRRLEAELTEVGS